MCPCDCELVDEQPRSMARLTLITGPVRIGSIREVATYECTRCHATLEVIIDEWGPDTWQRTPR